MNDRHPAAREPAKWHPMLEAVEEPVGTWHLIDSLDREYATVRLVRLDGEPTYRVEHRGVHIGYANTLRYACQRAHRAELDRAAPSHLGARHPDRRGDGPV